MTIESFNIVDGIPIGGGARPVYLAGPCVVESRDFVVDVAGRVAEIAARHGVPLVFKASYDKANRSSESSFRGPGVEEGLEALAEVKKVTGLPVITDVHHPEQAAEAAQVVDMLQVPAFLCRQTDLLHACGATGLPVNIKKGQFLAPEDMANAVEKVRAAGNDRVATDRTGHDLRLPQSGGGHARAARHATVRSGHLRLHPFAAAAGRARPLYRRCAEEFHPYLARAAAAAGVDGFFIEVHPDPPNAMSDATTQLSFDEFDRLLETARGGVGGVARGGPVSREVARQVLQAEADAIRNLMENLGEDFDRAVEMIDGCAGRVVLTGMGKSGIICRKIAATMRSTGTPALFMHPAEAIHGDLGMVAEWRSRGRQFRTPAPPRRFSTWWRCCAASGWSLIAITSNPESPSGDHRRSAPRRRCAA